MAEVADILSRPDQVSILPDLAAGCSMADMANLANVERAWRELSEVLDPDEQVTPVTYINSAADLKAFCGRHGGIVCTSPTPSGCSTGPSRSGRRCCFSPTSTWAATPATTWASRWMRWSIWDFDQPMGGLSPEQIKKAKIILWKGFCSVHQMFQPEHIDRFKEQFPETKVISHPESSFEVCQKSDYVGSTEVHHQDGPRCRAGHPLAGRHRTESGESSA